MIDLSFINCENCDKDYCNYNTFTCKCNFTSEYCKICESGGYDCEVANSFCITCKIKNISE